MCIIYLFIDIQTLKVTINDIIYLVVRPECASYNILGEEDRSARYTPLVYPDNYFNNCDKSGHRDISPDWKGPGWYRFQHPAGKILSQSPPGYAYCGTGFPGWSNSTLPDKPGDSVDIKICFYNVMGNCFESKEGKTTNCGSYYVYYLDNTPHCTLRYCGSN